MPLDWWEYGRDDRDSSHKSFGEFQIFNGRQVEYLSIKVILILFLNYIINQYNIKISKDGKVLLTHAMCAHSMSQQNFSILPFSFFHPHFLILLLFIIFNNYIQQQDSNPRVIFIAHCPTNGRSIFYYKYTLYCSIKGWYIW